jgi:hypothetical protein
MPNQGKPVRQTAAALLLCGLIVSVLSGFAAAQDGVTRGTHVRKSSQIHHCEHNLLLDATLSGNMDSFKVGLRQFDGGACQPKFLVYDFKKQTFFGFLALGSSPD